MAAKQKSNFDYEKNKLPMSNFEKQAVEFNRVIQSRQKIVEETGQYPSDSEVLARIMKNKKVKK